MSGVPAIILSSIRAVIPDFGLRRPAPGPAAAAAGPAAAAAAAAAGPGAGAAAGAAGPGAAGPGAAAISFKKAIKDLLDVITFTSTPNLTWQEIVNKLRDENFNLLKKMGYFLVAVPSAAVETGTKAVVGAAVVGVIIIVGGIKYLVTDSFINLYNRIKNFVLAAGRNLSNVPAAAGKMITTVKDTVKPVFKRVLEFISKKPGLSNKEIFDNLDKDIQQALTQIGYTDTSTEFNNLLNSLRSGLNKCDEKECIDNLVSGNDRHNLKQKLEDILKRLELNATDEFVKFQNKVIEILSDRFSLFTKFQQKVIDELYKIGVPQIPEIGLDFFQILNDDNSENSEHKINLREMREIYDEFDYDQIKT
jgi:hypothetical protein